MFRVGPVCGIVCVWALDVGILVRNKFLEFRKGKEMEEAFELISTGAWSIVPPLLALALAGWVQAALPWLMSAAAGCMVCVTAQEMIPEAVEADEPAGVISVVLGFALMMALDVAL